MSDLILVYLSIPQTHVPTGEEPEVVIDTIGRAEGKDVVQFLRLFGSSPGKRSEKDNFVTIMNTV